MNQFEKFADEVLDHYERFLLKCEYIIYIAVVEKKEENKFGLEIGVKFDGSENINTPSDLTDCQIYLGDFEPNTIPNRFPIPSKCSFSKEAGFKMHETATANIENSIKSFTTKIKEPHFNTEKFNNLRQKKEYSKIKGYPIQSKSDEATLGGVFKLEEFPNRLFGITNQHIFNYEGAKLGDSIYDKKRTEIGHLFWLSKTLFREVALVEMNENFSGSVRKEFKLGEPKAGMEVTHNGFGTASPNRTSEIISKNATVRIKDDHENDDWAIYKHQLLIDNNTTDGDSGSLVTTNESMIVGLNFARTFNRKVIIGEVNSRELSVANNINYILNHEFIEKQEIFVGKTTEKPIKIMTTLVDEFKTKTINL